MAPPTRSRSDALSALILAALTLVFFWPLFYGRTFSTVAGHQNSVYPWRAFPNEFVDCVQCDQADLSYPWQSFITQSFRDGEFPFWNPYSFGGQPFFANGSSAVLYPPRLIFSALFSPSWSHDLLSILHVFGAGVAMYFLMRDFRCGAAGSLFAAATWMFSSFNLAWLQLEVVAPVFLFLPLNLFMVRFALRRETLASCFAASAILASCLVAGHLPFMGITCLPAIVYAAVVATARAVRSARKSDWHGCVRTLGIAAGVAILPALLAAVVLLPTLINVGASQRGTPTYAEQHESVRAAASVFFRIFSRPPTPPNSDAMHGMTYIGIVAVPFVLLGAVCGVIRRRAGTWLALGIAVTVFLVATDTPLLRLAYAVIPGLGTFRPLGRLLFLYNFALAMLAGIGLDFFLRRLQKPAARAGADRLRVAGIALTAVALTLGTFHLIRYGRRLNPTFPPRTDALLYPATPLLDAVRRELTNGTSGPGRLLSILQIPGDVPFPPPILFGAESMMFGIESASGYDSVVPRRALALARIAGGETVEHVMANPDIGSACPFYQIRETRFDLLPRIGVTLLLAPPRIGEDPLWKERRSKLALETVYAGLDGQALRITGATPGAYIVHDAVIVQGEKDALVRFTDRGFDPRKSVVLESSAPASQPETAASDAVQTSEILKVTKRRNHWAASVRSAAPGWLVIPDTWSPGWRAQVNGKPVTLHRANYAFRAVPVPAGESAVRMDYHPEGFAAGGAISGGTMLALMLGTLIKWRRNCAPKKLTTRKG